MSGSSPKSYEEAVAWFNEAKARHHRCKVRITELQSIVGHQEEELHQSELRIAELKAENERLTAWMNFAREQMSDSALREVDRRYIARETE